MFTSSGMSWPCFCQSSIESSTPICRASALMWIGALFEPAIAEFVVVELACGPPFAGYPDDGAGACALAVDPAIEHRSTGKHDRGQIDGRRCHQASRRRLVAAGGQYHAVQRITEQDFDQANI